MRAFVARLLPFAILLFSVLVNAQTERAAITGRVTDPTKAVIAGARVSVINKDTNVRYGGATNNTGSYTITALPPGTYRVEVEKEGFRTIVQTGILLHVQDTVELNYEMALGATTQSVTVEGGAPIVNTTDATVSTVVDRQFAEDLPMNGRSFQTLIELTPGVVVTASNFQDNGQFSVNGQRAASNYWTVDGVSANIGIGAASNTPDPGNGLGGTLGSFSVLGGTNSLVSVDAMQEFRIQTSAYAPEFGRTPGGQIAIVTRSGTNQFHGTLFDYLRNDALDANNWFNTSVTPALAKSQERQNDFGGTFGGPILKDKTFFFFSYEGLRLRLPTTAFTTVPDANFTPGGTTNSRQNAIPAMQPYLNAFPLPNPNSPEIFNSVPCDPSTDLTCPPSGEKQVATGSAALNASYSNPATLDAYSLRIDHRWRGKWTFFGRYNYSPSKNLLRGSGGFVPLSQLQPETIITQTATAGATWVVSPTITNDLRFNFSRTDAESHYYSDNFKGAVPTTFAPYPSPYTDQDATVDLAILSLTGGFFNSGKSQHQQQRQINVIDSLAIQKGTHSLKFGVDYRRLSPPVDPPLYTLSCYFLDIPSAESGNLYYSLPQSSVASTFLFRNLGLYAQDTWRLNPSLTMTYGLRWDIDFVPQNISGPNFPAVMGFNLSNISSLALSPAGTSIYNTTYRNFAPRIGIAYRISRSQEWQTVARGGFGVFYDLATSEEGNVYGNTSYPFGSSATVFGGTFPLSATVVAPPRIVPPSPSNPAGLYAFDPHLQQPYTLQWNVAIEQVLGREQTVSASYDGAAGRRLIASPAIFSLNQSISSAQLVTNTGTSDYDALQLQFQRRLSHGLQALASYTWSHSIDTASAGSAFGNNANALIPSTVKANRGDSDFDVRNSLSAGMTYDIPAPNNILGNAVLHGWSLSNFVIARSAPPVTVSGFFFNGQVVEQIGSYFVALRPDVVSGQPLYLYGSQYPGGKALNPAAFTAPPTDSTGHFIEGNLGRNALRGFGATQWDFAVHREFPIHDTIKLQFRAEMFNVLNHPNFGPPSGELSFNPKFGLSTQMLAQSLNNSNAGGGGFDPLYQIGGPRSIQFALKLFF